ncbi:uncharacterized protein LOC120479247 [Pimephales promelas]|uniref:uncharacterized protein LOC120479247 n=1 Tax=Pimephales promelas TaxID=90988 RepID=UPI0019556D37|nr:uncharacterized protein LOC120479247 [Pimephales promelas]
MPFQFAIYYLYDKSLKVESTSILVDIDQHSQVTSKPDLDGDENWLEIKWPSRKEPEKTVPAKVLLFGDSFKDLVMKKNLLLLGKDIWNQDESRGVCVKKKMLDTSNNLNEAKKGRLQKQTKIKEAARDKMLQKLKNSLSQSRAVDTQDQNTSSEDEVPQCLHNVNLNTKKAARPLAFTSDHHISSDEATNIASPLRPDHHTSSDDATNIGSPEMANDSDEDFGLTSTQRRASRLSPKTKDSNTRPKMLSQMDEEIMTSLRELPEMIKSVTLKWYVTIKDELS